MKLGDVYRFKRCNSTNPDYWGVPLVVSEIHETIIGEIHESFVVFRCVRLGVGDHFNVSYSFKESKFRTEEVNYDS